MGKGSMAQAHMGVRSQAELLPWREGKSFFSKCFKTKVCLLLKYLFMGLGGLTSSIHF